MGEVNDAACLVYDYQVRKSLSKIGYRFNDDELTDFEAQYLTFIHSEFDKHKMDDQKRALGKRK